MVTEIQTFFCKMAKGQTGEVGDPVTQAISQSVRQASMPEETPSLVFLVAAYIYK